MDSRNDSIVEIDGAQGEGGGQVMRTALALSILTQRPLVLRHIRARRPQPGLKPQHLKSVDAAAAICHAEVNGAQLNSQTLTFKPGALHSGRYRFDIGTAGAAMLVLQTIFVPLSFAGAASSVTITGGTHVPWSPPFDYIEKHWLPVMRLAGYDAQLGLRQAGYYPQGDGKIEVTIQPTQPARIQPINWTTRGALQQIYAVAGSSNLPEHVTERMKRQTLQRLQNLPEWHGQPKLHVKQFDLPATGKGAFLVLCAEYENGRGCFAALGELSKPSERVADEAIDDFLAFHAGQAAVDPCLADQMMLPLAFASAPSSLTTSALSQHLLTQADILRRFLPIEIELSGGGNEIGRVDIRPIV